MNRKIIENNMSENKITNCSRCGTNPWKQGCYALWGKSPKDLLHDKNNDSGYICSVCAIGMATRSRTLQEVLDERTPPHDFAERYKQCPVYGKKNTDSKVNHDIYKTTREQLEGLKCEEKDDPNLAEKISKAVKKDKEYE